MPHSEVVLSCRECFALGYIDCEFCSKLPMKCYECSKDNSNQCNCCIAKQRKECKNCDGKGTLKCKTCEGRGRLLQSKILHIQFKGDFFAFLAVDGHRVPWRLKFLSSWNWEASLKSNRTSWFQDNISRSVINSCAKRSDASNTLWKWWKCQKWLPKWSNCA